MSRRQERRQLRQTEALIKIIIGVFVLAALAIGGVTKLVPTLIALVIWALGLVAFVAVVYLGYRFYRARSGATAPIPNAIPVFHHKSATPQPAPSSSAVIWDQQRIETALGEIDWYQFEKFCAALLRTEGYTVERKGGAQPDGGVDLVATKAGEAMLVQCKHWKTWTVQEKVIRELLGSMTHYRVNRGALYVLKGATRPADAFATQHNITVVNGQELARRAFGRLSGSELAGLLSSRDHHCPKCESPMVWRTGDFTPFWGCSTYPRCRGILKHTGVR